MPFQIVASIFMIIPLYIYHGYEKDEPSTDAINKATKHKVVAIIFFYFSRFLSGFAAGMLIFIFSKSYFLIIYFRYVLCSDYILFK
jgi:hypothetical protein